MRLLTNIETVVSKQICKALFEINVQMEDLQRALFEEGFSTSQPNYLGGDPPSFISQKKQ